MRSPKAKSRPQRGPKRAVAGTGRGGSAGAKILAAIDEATEILRSEGLPSERLTVRTYKVVPAPRAYSPGDVKRVRGLLGTSQAVLAGFRRKDAR